MRSLWAAPDICGYGSAVTEQPLGQDYQWRLALRRRNSASFATRQAAGTTRATAASGQQEQKPCGQLAGRPHLSLCQAAMHQQLAENSPKLRGTAMPLESLASRLGEILHLPSDNLKAEDSPWLCCLNEVSSEGDHMQGGAWNGYLHQPY